MSASHELLVERIAAINVAITCIEELGGDATKLKESRAILDSQFVEATTAINEGKKLLKD